MDVPIVALICLSFGIIVAHDGPGEFKMDYYTGPQANAVIAVYYKDNFDLPKCYGALINWDVVLVPCSCVIRQPQLEDTANWWNNRINKSVSPDQASNYKANAMKYEYLHDNAKTKFMVSVAKIKIEPQCRTNFQYNLAKIKLEKPIQGTKLAWVPDVFEKRLKARIEHASAVIATDGYCLINMWATQQDLNGNGTQPSMDQNLTRITERYVTMKPWSFCSEVVCPKHVHPPNGERNNINTRVCDNDISGSRRCMHWEGTGSLCSVIPGTPVFCNVGSLVGLTGFIHNSSMWCPGTNMKYAVMEGIDLALHLIKYDIRMINAVTKTP